MARRRWLVVALLLGVWMVVTAHATLIAVRPVPPVGQPRRTPNGLAQPPRLTQHVLFVIIDGLRLDVATDAQRMPRLSRVLRERHGAVIRAGRITMTSSAVLAFGAGQRGGLDQVLENLNPPPVGANDWLENAHRAGLRLAVAGDRAWSQLYGSSLSDYRPDPEGVGIDYDFNRQTFRNAEALRQTLPDLLVAHFVTPDHQGHAYGIESPRYARHMHDFDRELFDWVDSFSADWTVIVTSDHGAADSGTHGTDTQEQRLCPFLAFGPGIRSRHPANDELDQVQIPGLLSALLGVDNALQSRASVPFEWLDVTADEARALGCREIERLSAVSATQSESPIVEASRVARACCTASNAPCTEQARALAERYDEARARAESWTNPSRSASLLVALGVALVAALRIIGRAAVPVIGAGACWLAVSVGLTYGVERLPGVWPNTARAALFTVANAMLLILIVRFTKWAPWLGRHAALTLGIVPGWLLVSYTANTQVEAWVAVVVLLTSLLVARPTPSASSKDLASSNDLASSKDLAFAKGLARAGTWVVGAGAVAVLSLPGTRASDVTPVAFVTSPTLASSMACALTGLGLAFVFWSRRGGDAVATARDVRGPSKPKSPSGGRITPARTDLVHVPSRSDSATRVRNVSVRIACFASLFVASFWLRHVPLSWVGRVTWIALVMAAAAALAFRRSWLAFVLGVASTLWVARDFECVVLASVLVVAALAAQQRAPGRQRADAHGRKAGAWLELTLLFSLSYLAWIGYEGGLQLNAMDFTAGTFGDSHVPAWFVATCLAYKFTVAEVLLLITFARGTPASDRYALFRGLLLCHLARGSTLLVMLAVCGTSYWTAFRVIADLPFAVVGSLGVFVLLMITPFTTAPTKPPVQGSLVLRKYPG